MVSVLMTKTVSHSDDLVCDIRGANSHFVSTLYSKACLKRPLKLKTKIEVSRPMSLDAGQQYCRMLPLEHSAILLTSLSSTGSTLSNTDLSDLSTVGTCDIFVYQMRHRVM